LLKEADELEKLPGPFEIAFVELGVKRPNEVFIMFVP
jgi:hypothetical protein